MSDWMSEFECFIAPHGAEFKERQNKKKLIALVNQKFNDYYKFSNKNPKLKTVKFDIITTTYYYNTT